MQVQAKLQFLRIALFVIGLFFIFGIYPAMHFFPESWGWTPRQSEYEQMILGIYATLGIFLILSSYNPLEHRSLIWFTVWSSIVHATIMLFQAITDISERANLHGDVPALFAVAILLALLLPKKSELAKF